MIADNEFTDIAESALFIKLSRLKKRNIVVNNKKTSVTLEPLVWEIFHDIAEDKKCHVNDLCGFIDSRKHKDSSLASAIRIFVMAYMNIKLLEKTGINNDNTA